MPSVVLGESWKVIQWLLSILLLSEHAQFLHNTFTRSTAMQLRPNSDVDDSSILQQMIVNFVFFFTFFSCRRCRDNVVRELSVYHFSRGLQDYFL